MTIYSDKAAAQREAEKRSRRTRIPHGVHPRGTQYLIAHQSDIDIWNAPPPERKRGDAPLLAAMLIAASQSIMKRY